MWNTSTSWWTNNTQNRWKILSTLWQGRLPTHGVQLQLWLSWASWRNIKSSWQKIQNFPWCQPPQNDSIILTGATPGRELQGSHDSPPAEYWAEYPPDTGSLQHTALRGSRFQGPIGGSDVLLMHSLPAKASVCWDRSLVTLQPASQFCWCEVGDWGERRRIGYHCRLPPPKPLLPKGYPSVQVLLPSVRSGNPQRCWGSWVEWKQLPLKGLWKSNAGHLCQAVSKALSPGFFYLWITLTAPNVCVFMQ